MKKTISYGTFESKWERIMERYISVAWMIFIPIGIIIAIASLIIQSNTPLNEQDKADILAKEQMLTQDFSKLAIMEGTEVDIKDSQIIVGIEGEECRVVAVYDQNNNLVSKSFEDTRPCASYAGWLFITLCGMFLGMLMYLMVWFVFGIIDGVILIVREHRKGEYT